jgi:RHS repeat-associated protein
MNTKHLLLLGVVTSHLTLQSRAAADSIQQVSVDLKPSSQVTPNRSVPKVDPPKTPLEFSANPTAQEISRAGVFQEPLVPIGGQPGADENAALASALLGYAKRSGPDDFASLTGFLEEHPQSPWRAALLTVLGIEYHNTAYYSRALEAWQEAWALGQKAKDAKGKFLADRTVCELAGLYSRLGRMTELEALLKSVEKRGFIGGPTERINLAWEALSMMQNQPGVSFRCGPLALKSILRSDDKLRTSCSTNAMMEIFNSVSTQKGFSLSQVAELSKKIGLNYQMAFRGPGSSSVADVSAASEESKIKNQKSKISFIVPSVVHWKVGHYAAIVRRDGARYLVEDLTFGSTVWATREALEAETSGYFLIPPGELPRGWRTVDANEGAAIWGKGVTGGNDPDQYTCSNEQTASCTGSGCGMAIATVHLMLANLQIRDTPVGYTPPIGPPVSFTVRYNHRDYLQPASEVNKMLGPKWTHDWHGYIQINNNGADAKYFVEGGGARIFRDFDTNTQTYAPNQYDQTLLRRSGPGRYEMTWPDGSKKIFGHGAPLGTLLTQVIDPAGNAVTLTYDGPKLVALTDAIGQVTTISYNHTNNPALITRVTDPFGRFATFEYTEKPIALPNYVSPDETGLGHDHIYFLTKITDVLGLESQFAYDAALVGSAHTGDSVHQVYSSASDIIKSMTTPYGSTSFTLSGGSSLSTTNTTRVAQIHYPDGSRERVEYNQTEGLIPGSDPPGSVPTGMLAFNGFLYGRSTYYWSRTAMASSGGFYTKAKHYHWLHNESFTLTSGILESTKEPLENRVYFNYPGHGDGVSPVDVGTSSRPTRIGRVLEDGQTQLYTNGYNAFGHVTRSMDPVGRTLSYVYASNGIDLLEVRQTRAGNNELLARMTYDGQHRPLTVVDAAGQTSTFTYNARGQPLTATNAKGETTTCSYDSDGYLIAVDGPLPGTSDTVTAAYDFYGRIRTMTSLSGYTVTFDYDAMDRLGKITHPDATFEQFTYTNLDIVTVQDRAGRQTLFEVDSMRQVKTQTDPLGRVTHFEWCRCGDIKSLTDPMGRTTFWFTDVQGRVTGKRYGDGSLVSYVYESASSRLKHVIDEKDQVTLFDWNRDDTLNSIGYGNAAIPTPGVSFTYDPNYRRVISMTDGTGTTLYSYNPITDTPTLGAGALASVNGPLPNDTITYSYDELGRPVHRAINGVGSALTFDAAWRVVAATNTLGAFAYAYEGITARLVSRSLPNGQTEARSYGNNLQDRMLQRITHQIGATPLSEFLYGHDVSKGRIATWSQQVGATPPSLHTFGYDAVNQLLSATVTNAGSLVSTFAYGYDPAANRLTEQVGASNYSATFNALNEISTSTAPGFTRTNEWDAEDRLVAVNVGNQRTEFTYDGLSRRVAIRQLVNGSEVSFRRFVWCGDEICEERDGTGAVTKRFFPQGMKVESGPNAGNYFYTHDHLGSIRELTDGSGNVRARYAYDPYGRRTRLTGDMEADFGFAGMFWSSEANLFLTHYRAYDPELGRWLSRDPLPDAEMLQGPNLYAYVLNDPVNLIDPEGLVSIAKCLNPAMFTVCAAAGIAFVQHHGQRAAQGVQSGLQWVGRGFQRVGSAIGNCFSRAPSAPPPVASPAPQTAIQIIRPAGQQVRNWVTMNGERLYVEGKRAATVASEQTVNLNERLRVANDWWARTVQATEPFRQTLPNDQARWDAIREITETMERLFGL